MAPTQPQPSSKSICEVFFKEINPSRRKCNKHKSKNGGWNNLLSHLCTFVGDDYKAEFNAHQKAVESKTVRFFVRISPREKEMYKWVNFVVMKNLPLSFVDCPITRSITKLKPVSLKTLRRTLLSLLDIV